MYAIISYKGRQHRIEPGTVFTVDRVEAEPGASVKLEDCVLMASGDDGLKTGSPTVRNAMVELEVMDHFRDRKLVVFKMKRRKSHRRKQGHRQEMTRVRVKDIVLG